MLAWYKSPDHPGFARIRFRQTRAGQFAIDGMNSAQIMPRFLSIPVVAAWARAIALGVIDAGQKTCLAPDTIDGCVSFNSTQSGI